MSQTGIKRYTISMNQRDHVFHASRKVRIQMSALSERQVKLKGQQLDYRSFVEED
jgi:hypothetical protein